MAPLRRVSASVRPERSCPHRTYLRSRLAVCPKPEPDLSKTLGVLIGSVSLRRVSHSAPWEGSVCCRLSPTGLTGSSSLLLGHEKQDSYRSPSHVKLTLIITYLRSTINSNSTTASKCICCLNLVTFYST